MIYKVLKTLGTSVIYFDTDSVIYEVKDGDEIPLPTGDYLGHLTHELNPGTWITEFVSGGPKSYAYRTSDGLTVCKVKGFRLDFKTSSVINFEAMKAEVFNWHEGRDSTVFAESTKICRDKKKASVFNRRERKRFNIVYNKRYVLHNLDTLPFGYKAC